MGFARSVVISDNGFYEKVVKVKADVAAILNFSLPTITNFSLPTITTKPQSPIGGMRKGGFSGAL